MGVAVHALNPNTQEERQVVPPSAVSSRLSRFTCRDFVLEKKRKEGRKVGRRKGGRDTRHPGNGDCTSITSPNTDIYRGNHQEGNNPLTRVCASQLILSLVNQKTISDDYFSAILFLNRFKV